MIRMKVAMRTCRGIKSRSADTSALDSTSTKVVASPMASALIPELLTASTGHMPSTCTNTGFSRHSPLMKSSVDSALSACLSLPAIGPSVAGELRLQAIDQRHPLRAALAQDGRHGLG